MTDRKYAVQYQVGDEMCTRPCSTLGTAVMVRNHIAATGHEDAMLVEAEVVEIIARSGFFSVVEAKNYGFILNMTRDELRAKAKDLDITGRGGMDKGQLRAAVLQAYGYTS